MDSALYTGLLSKESSIAKHERCGSMILQQWNSVEMQSGLRGLVTDGDAPQEDEMIIFGQT